jgi:hypothetical protein
VDLVGRGVGTTEVGGEDERCGGEGQAEEVAAGGHDGGGFAAI